MAKAPYLGFMLDVSRHFMSVEDVLKLLDAAAVCGVNTMHWHLTDDQGWRIEIKKYPRLTQVGSVRGDSFFGAVSETEHNCGYYTQEQIRRVVAYALERGIQIIPEIEIPGHASAMLAAYPQFGCGREVLRNGETVEIELPYDRHVVNIGGIFPNLICAGKEEAIRFLKDILDEVTDLFPAPYVHIGGDEALKLHWRRCPHCQKRMRREGLKNEEELQRALVLQIGAYLAEKGKQTIVYNDCLAGGILPKHFIVQQWLGNHRATAEFMKSGGKVIRSDTQHFYYDYAYSTTSPYDIWNAPAVPDYAEGAEDGLLGVECMLWAERITNLNRAGTMLFPRLPAAILKATHPEAYPTWESFAGELRRIQGKLEDLGFSGAPEALWKPTPEAKEADRREDEGLKTSPGAKLAEQEERRLLLQEELEKLLAAIEMPRPFALRVMDEAFKALPTYCGKDSSDSGDGVEELADQLLTALHNREDGPWKDLPEEIWLDTMKCFPRFVKEHHRSCGYYGFDRSFWTTRQINARLFRIGQLEYELKEEAGKKIISLHIPSDTRMEMALLDESLAQARQFLGMYFPDWAQAPMECESWLLSPVLGSLLPEGSHILAFQRAFTVDLVNPNPNDVLEWVFQLTDTQQKGIALEDLPENTSLQKSMKAFLLSGGKVGVARGWLSSAFCKK